MQGSSKDLFGSRNSTPWSHWDLCVYSSCLLAVSWFVCVFKPYVTMLKYTHYLTVGEIFDLGDLYCSIWSDFGENEKEIRMPYL